MLQTSNNKHKHVLCVDSAPLPLRFESSLTIQLCKATTTTSSTFNTIRLNKFYPNCTILDWIPPCAIWFWTFSQIAHSMLELASTLHPLFSLTPGPLKALCSAHYCTRCSTLPINLIVKFAAHTTLLGYYSIIELKWIEVSWSWSKDLYLMH